MTLRETPLQTGEYYHIYNRGVDKRIVFMDRYDLLRFLKSMSVFNSKKPIESLFAQNLKKNLISKKDEKLVEIVAFCLNPNHFHLILKQKIDGGISEFMKRLSGGYTWYFNNKYERSGSLFQGRFKSIHIGSNEYLLHLSAYVNLNYKVHNFSGSTAKITTKIFQSSWEEYLGTSKYKMCSKDIILGQFKTSSDYKTFAVNTLKDIWSRRSSEEHEFEIRKPLPKKFSG